MVAPHFHGLYSSLELCCEGPWFTSIQEHGCEKRAHQLYLGAERITPVIPNWFQPWQCCCCLCYLGEYLRLGTLISYNWAQVPAQLWSPCCRLWRLCQDAQLNLPVLPPLLLSHQCHQQSRGLWLFCLQCWQCLHDLFGITITVPVIRRGLTGKWKSEHSQNRFVLFMKWEIAIVLQRTSKHETRHTNSRRTMQTCSAVII